MRTRFRSRAERRDPVFEARVAETASQWNESLLFISVLGTPAAALACRALFQNRLNPWWLVLSFVAAGLCIGARLIVRRRPSPGRRLAARGMVTTAVAVAGLMWGLLPVAVAGTRDSSELMVAAMLFPVGASGINVMINATSRLRFFLLQTGMFGVLDTYLLLAGGRPNRVLAFTGIGFCVLNSTLHKTALSASFASIRAQLTNADLLEAAHRDAERIELANERLAQQATHDDLTGLLNRRGLMVLLEAAHSEAIERGELLCVMVGDLDRFKVVNDSLGHAAGDTLLRIVADRLTAAAPAGAFLARLGGDELVVVVPGGPGSASAATERTRMMAVAEHLRSQVAAPITLGTQQVVVSLSLGVAFSSQDAAVAEDLLRHADSALYRAKGAGRDRVETFDQSMRSSVARRVSDEHQLRQAIDGGEIVPYYQPIIDSRSGRVIGAEVLARWAQPAGEVLVAGTFIGLAEETGLVEPMSEAILARALIDVAAWERLGLPERFRISVNLPPRFVSATSRTGRLTDLLGRAPLHRLCLEVTENAIVDDMELAAARLDAYRAAGATIALDDFGTGSASLTLLQRMPLDGVKLDRSFVTNIVAQTRDRLLVRGFVSLANTLGLSVVAEGVETLEQAVALVAVGCDVHQGWLYSKAVPAEEFEAALRQPDEERSGLDWVA